MEGDMWPVFLGSPTWTFSLHQLPLDWNLQEVARWVNYGQSYDQSAGVMPDLLGQTSRRLHTWTRVLPQNCCSHSVLGVKPSLCLAGDDKRELLGTPLHVYCGHFPGHLICCLLPYMGFLGGSEGKGSTHNGWDPGLIPGLGRSPGEGNSCPFQYSCQENSMDRSLVGYRPWTCRVGHDWETNIFTFSAIFTQIFYTYISFSFALFI